MEKRTINLQGEPYFVLEREGGIFRIVQSVEMAYKSTSPLPHITLNSEGEDLVEKKDLIEVPTRGLCLAVRCLEDIHGFLSTLDDLKKLAQITENDFFSYETFGNKMRYYEEEFRTKQGTGLIIQPRLFKKVVNY